MTPDPIPPTDTLTLLFSSDPLDLTDSQLDTAITELRRRRSAFASSEAVKQLAPPKAKAPKAKPVPADIALGASLADVDLDDL